LKPATFYSSFPTLIIKIITRIIYHYDYREMEIRELWWNISFGRFQMVKNWWTHYPIFLCKKCYCSGYQCCYCFGILCRSTELRYQNPV
jgi:hypothetical protein